MNWSDWQAELLERIADPSLSAETAPALNPAGLAVYRNNYRVGLIDTLAFIYPVCRQLVGGDFFTGLARVFIGGHPSLSGNLHLYGAAFGDFVAGFEHARELPYLADVARLEWRVHRAYYAADAAPADSAALAAFPQQRWGELKLRPLPDVAALLSPWPAASIWLAHQRQPVELNVDLHSQPEAMLIYRLQGRVQVEIVGAGLAALLQAFRDGATLEAAVEQALAAEAGFDLQAGLLRLFQQRLIQDVTL
ncbi:putative DNA-binding domain-containing protein [Chromobacterium haemolyticum]|uniref:DNA-binding domain-containing protein n=1 Tax=Chromobacterium haemolyticum TaxID=394935 RepID=A0ABS3GHV2_9NEIS|nr:DNA-binding domain-containing protein [Chromobacterium haemolyticum]MBK0413525.1 putative DNA-binding domain-containing protein [Chromobacterium haemolyticum]MBO0414627.1 putative DNA-binding domain-containing protein [Chromobacterium haemolyticum]MBO0497887.1 putative DNA-binding domain-containing protein [Chromobacterium haemolyticum]